MGTKFTIGCEVVERLHLNSTWEAGGMSAVSDPLQSPITTLRVSVTGDCNLSCFYCKPLGRSVDLIRDETLLLSPSEYSKIAKAAGEAGIGRVLIAGGEPLLRKDISAVSKAFASNKKIKDVRFLTNGTFLKNHADSLRRAGVRHVEVNFDSLNFVVFQKISRCDSLHRVLDGLDKVERVGFTTIIANITVMRGVNENELVDFAMLTKERNLELRFHEYLPRNDESTLTGQLHLPAHRIKKIIESFQPLVALSTESGEKFRFQDGSGSMAFYSGHQTLFAYNEPKLVLHANGTLAYDGLGVSKNHNLANELGKDGADERLIKVFSRFMQPPTPKSSARTGKAATTPRARKGRDGNVSRSAGSRSITA